MDCANYSIIGTNTNNLAETGNCAASLNTDPVLDVLGNNGGPTQTMMLLPGSPAINAGDDASCPVTDQRGSFRWTLVHCDIGAYELGNHDPTDIALSASSVTENLPAGTTVGTLTTTDPDVTNTHTYSFACAVPRAQIQSPCGLLAKKKASRRLCWKCDLLLACQLRVAQNTSIELFLERRRMDTIGQ